MSKWVNEGEAVVADILFDTTDPATSFDPLELGLYTDATEPPETATLGTISEVAGGTGYVRKDLDRGSWTRNDDESTYAQQSFTASGGAWGNVYGYFITDGTNLLAVEHFSDGPYNVGDGDSIKITPKITVS